MVATSLVATSLPRVVMAISAIVLRVPVETVVPVLLLPVLTGRTHRVLTIISTVLLIVLRVPAVVTGLLLR